MNTKQKIIEALEDTKKGCGKNWDIRDMEYFTCEEGTLCPECSKK